MSEIAKTDTQILHFLNALQNQGEKDLKMLALDTEPVKLLHRVVFDVAFQTFDPTTTSPNERGDMKGSLVYEVISDHELMTHIINQERIANATEDNYFSLIKKLQDKKWYGSVIEDTIYAKDIRRKWEPSVASAAGKIFEGMGLENPIRSEADVLSSYNDTKNLLRDLRSRIDNYYDQIDSPSPFITRVRNQEVVLKEETANLLILFDNLLNSQKHIGNFASEVGKLNKALGSDLTKLRDNVKRNYMKHIKASGGLKGKTPSNPGLDFQLFKELSGKQEVDYFDSIMKELDKELKTDDVLGVMGHSIQSDITWLNNTAMYVDGASNWIGYFTEKKISRFCSLGLFKRLESMNRENLLNAMFSLNRGELYNSFNKKIQDGTLPKMLSGAEAKGKFTLEALFNNIMNTNEGKTQTQTHTARGDVTWSIDLITKTFEEMVKNGAFKIG